MSLLDELQQSIRDEKPEWECALLEDGETLHIAEEGHLGDEARPQFHVQHSDGSIFLDWVWRLPVTEGKAAEIRRFVLDYVAEGIDNHGWQVPILLHGGPRAGQSLTHERADLVGRLLFARPSREGQAPTADIYKWHLQRNARGEYLCVYESSLEGPVLDEFIARGVESTGPFVVIRDAR